METTTTTTATTAAPDSYTKEIKEAIRARALLIWTQTTEEQRTERKLIETAAALGLNPYTWTVTTGLHDETTGRTDTTKADPTQLFNPAVFPGKPGRALIILKDIRKLIDAAPLLARQIRDEMSAAKKRKPEDLKVWVFIDTEETPPSVPGLYRAALPLPNRAEIRALIDAAAETLDTPEKAAALDREAITEALTGLDSDALLNALNKSRVKTGTYTPAEIVKEKRALINSDALEWTDTSGENADTIGGLEILKADLLKFRAAIGPDAREYGLPAPRGFLLAGVPGTGKSLSARAAGNIWNLPVIRLNVGALFGKYVGETESKFRAVIQQLRALAPAIVHIDEIEKAFSGAGGSGDSDGGTGQRLFGEFLTFLNDKTEPLFIIATANNIEKLPPEMKRAGRFDRIFFIDVPTRRERLQIATVMMKKYPRTATTNPEAVADASADYTGAEIEAAYTTALYTAYNAGRRNPETADILEALTEITPIAKAEADALNKMRDWSRTAARAASIPDSPTTATTGNEFITN